jgi:MOSC domain-containing protein YiiM
LLTISPTWGEADAMASLIDVRTGHATRRGKYVTAYAKASQAGAVAAHALGLAGDEVANHRVHGGPEKAVYCYAAASYPLWRTDMPGHAALLVPGGFGENLLWGGATEATVCIGDRWRIGSVLLEIAQPRQPCATMARWFDDARMVAAMADNGRSGWYCRVAEPGVLRAGDAITLEDRLADAWPVARLLAVSYAADPDAAALRDGAAHPRLAKSWATWMARMAKAAEARVVGPAGLEPATKPL